MGRRCEFEERWQCEVPRRVYGSLKESKIKTKAWRRESSTCGAASLRTGVSIGWIRAHARACRSCRALDKTPKRARHVRLEVKDCGVWGFCMGEENPLPARFNFITYTA
jgi:hypothetical protein